MSLTEKTDIRDSDEKVVEIEMERLRNFTNHPFKIRKILIRIYMRRMEKKIRLPYRRE